MTLRYGTALLGLTSLWFMAAKPYEGCRAFIAKAPFRAAHSHMFLLKKKMVPSGLSSNAKRIS